MYCSKDLSQPYLEAPNVVIHKTVNFFYYNKYVILICPFTYKFDSCVVTCFFFVHLLNI